MGIQDIRKTIHSPQKAYMWEVEIQGSAAGALQDLTLYAKSISIPQSAVEQLTINHKGGKSHYAGKDSSAHTVTATFFDDENQTVSKYFNDWFNTYVSDPSTANGSSKSEYAADIVIKMKDSTDENVTAQWKLSKSFPIDIGEVSLSYDSSDAIELSVTFSYDEKLSV